MVDKIYSKSEYEITIVFTNKAPLTITSSEPNAYQLWEWLTTPTAAQLTFPQFQSALAGQTEETQNVQL